MFDTGALKHMLQHMRSKTCGTSFCGHLPGSLLPPQAPGVTQACPGIERKIGRAHLYTMGSRQSLPLVVLRRVTGSAAAPLGAFPPRPSLVQ